MDPSLLTYRAVGVLVGGVALTLFFLLVLIVWSPPPIITRDSEKFYRSPTSPNPKPLPSLSDPATIDLTVVIPAYNETTRLPSMLATTIAHLQSTSTSPSSQQQQQQHPKKQPPRTYEILIIDDGSTDQTTQTALSLARQYPKNDIRIVTLEKNIGKGGGVRHGMMVGRGRRLLMVDADGASRFEDLELLWRAMDKLAPDGGPAMVIGSRAHLVKTEAVVKRSFLRNVLMYGLHTILRIVGVGHIRDTQCGFKLFSRTAAQQLFPLQHLATWIFDVELILLAKYMQIPVVEVAVEWHEVAGSKLNVMVDSLQMLRDLLVLRVNYLLGRWKITRPREKRD